MNLRNTVLLAVLLIPASLPAQRVSCTASVVSTKVGEKKYVDSWVARCAIWKVGRDDKPVWVRDLPYPVGQKRYECLKQIDVWMNETAPELAKRVTQESGE